MSWLHHVLNHFPIAFTQLAAAALIIAWLRPSDKLAAASRWITYVAALSAVPVAATGLLSAGHFVEAAGEATGVALHRNLALAGTALMLVAAGLTWAGAKQARRGIAALGFIAALAAAGTVAVGGHFGGEMLHVGMAPWSAKEAHSHGPAEPQSAESAHAADEHAAPIVGTGGAAHPMGMASGSSAAPASAASMQYGSAMSGMPGMSAAPPAMVRPRPTRPPTSKPEPPAAKPPAPAGQEAHSEHQH